MLRLTTQIAAIVMATLFVYFFPKEINIVSEEVCWKESKREKCICHARETTGKRESIKVQKHPPLWKSYNNKVSV